MHNAWIKLISNFQLACHITWKHKSENHKIFEQSLLTSSVLDPHNSLIEDEEETSSIVLSAWSMNNFSVYRDTFIWYLCVLCGENPYKQVLYHFLQKWEILYVTMNKYTSDTLDKITYILPGFCSMACLPKFSSQLKIAFPNFCSRRQKKKYHPSISPRSEDHSLSIKVKMSQGASHNH